MFLQYFRLREQPFGVTPDPRFLFPSPGHSEALASLIYGIESNLGFGALMAEPGMGKTTLLYHILERYRQSARTAFIFNTQCSSYDFLQSFLAEIDEKQVPRETFQLHERLKQILAQEATTRRRVVLVIDEAQNLGDMVMETVRLLSNFESTNSKLLHIILAGQPELAAKLAGSGLSQLLQRIPILSNLQRLTLEEVAAYVEHRLRIAGSQGKPLFRPETVERIAQLSRGVPREINRLCFNSLSLAYAAAKPVVDLQVVEEVAADLDLSAHFPKGGEATGQANWPAVATSRVGLSSGPARPSAFLEGAVTSPAAAATMEGLARAASRNNRAAGGRNGRALQPTAHQKAISRPYTIFSYGSRGRARPLVFASLYLALVAAGWMGVTRWLNAGPSTDAAHTAGGEENDLATQPDTTGAPARDSSSSVKSAVARRTAAEAAHGRPRSQGAASTSNPGRTAHVAKLATYDVQSRRPRPPGSAASGNHGSRRAEPSIQTSAQRELLSFVPVQYPETALDRHIEGTVVLNAMLATDGTVKNITPVSGNPLLVNAAATAVRGWVYRPHRINGTAVAIDKQIVISFSLSRGSNP